MTARRIPLRDLLVLQGPVLSRRARAALLDPERGAGVAYTGPARASFPVMPLQVFGIHYDVDLVLADDHPDWDMHEYAVVRTRQGPVWLCKDTRTDGLRQTVISALPGLERAIPEIPLERSERPVQVVDRSDDRRLRLDLRYVNLDGDDVHLRWAGRRPHGRRPGRNSSTMGHSADDLLVVLDIPTQAFASEAVLTIGGRVRRPYRIARLVPLSIAIVQTQGGFSRGAFTQAADADGCTTVHARDGVPEGIRQAWTRSTDADGNVVLEQAGDVRVLRHVFRPDGDALELVRAEALPWDGGEPVFVAHFSPPIPDVRRPFAGAWQGRYVLDVRGRPSHGVGTVRVASTADGARLHLDPEAPRWTTDRPMRAEVRFADGEATVRIGREPGADGVGTSAT